MGRFDGFVKQRFVYSCPVFVVKGKTEKLVQSLAVRDVQTALCNVCVLFLSDCFYFSNSILFDLFGRNFVIFLRKPQKKKSWASPYPPEYGYATKNTTMW